MLREIVCPVQVLAMRSDSVEAEIGVERRRDLLADGARGVRARLIIVAARADPDLEDGADRVRWQRLGDQDLELDVILARVGIVAQTLRLAEDRAERRGVDRDVVAAAEDAETERRGQRRRRGAAAGSSARLRVRDAAEQRKDQEAGQKGSYAHG
jgi:hypothetical protein